MRSEADIASASHRCMQSRRVAGGNIAREVTGRRGCYWGCGAPPIGLCLRSARFAGAFQQPAKQAWRIDDQRAVSRGVLAVISPVAIRMTWMALPITSAGRFSPFGPLGIRIA
jgi:hypothetical protein